MKYQLIKHNKTGSRTLAIVPTMTEALELVKNMTFREFSYMGGFPVYTDPKGKTHSIQGAVMIGTSSHIACSLNKEDIALIK